MKPLILAIELHIWLIMALADTAPVSCTMTVYSYEVPNGGPKHSHTWIVFQQGKGVVEISWGPIGAVRPLGPREAGRNYSHAETLGFAKLYGAEVKSFGPYPCSQKMFDRAKAQKARLENGYVSYKAAALCFGSHRANCYTAVVQIGKGEFAGGFSYGHEASKRVAEFLLRSDHR